MSGDSILTAPWLQNAELLALPPVAVVLPAGVWTPLVQADPQRMTLTVIPGDWGFPPSVSPVPAGTGGMLAGITAVVPSQIHAAVWPLLIGGAWWGYSSMGQTVTVISTLRTGR